VTIAVPSDLLTRFANAADAVTDAVSASDTRRT
jgi:hypothetical protein